MKVRETSEREWDEGKKARLRKETNVKREKATKTFLYLALPTTQRLTILPEIMTHREAVCSLLRKDESHCLSQSLRRTIFFGIIWLDDKLKGFVGKPTSFSFFNFRAEHSLMRFNHWNIKHYWSMTIHSKKWSCLLLRASQFLQREGRLVSLWRVVAVVAALPEKGWILHFSRLWCLERTAFGHLTGYGIASFIKRAA